jgi:hypothetical protein
MSVCVVTGYVPLPCEHRSRERYNELGAKLLECCNRSIVFRQELGDCWLSKKIGNVELGGKDSTAYHCVQHEKFSWLERASTVTDSTTLIWIDYGVFHMPGVTKEIVCDFIRRVEESEPDVIVSPSGSAGDPFGSNPTWLFLGAVFVVPSRLTGWLSEKCREHLDPLSWEVNTLARVQQKYPESFRFCSADHNHSIFDNYK